MNRAVIAGLCLMICLYGEKLIAVQAFAEGDNPVHVSPESAAADPDFSVQGEYATAAEASPQRGVQVVALGRGNFRVVVFQGGLPGAGWDRNLPQVLEDEDAEGVRELLASMSVARMTRTSPTLGAEPPPDATVLFDGSAEGLRQNWNDGAKQTADGFLAAGATTKKKFRDYTLHLEFRTPYMPAARGQKRGNSGVYHQGRYETQILDSFGLDGNDNEAGGIYEVRKPDLNLCFPPLSWQTYDVDFTAARFDAEGKKRVPARMTVRLNGIVVQRDVAVPGITRAAPGQESAEDGPLHLQDHGDPVSFRNIWIVARDADREARRPRISGYERFLALSDRPQEAGLLLAGELGCTNCHAAPESLQAELRSRRGPVLTQLGKRLNPEWMLKFIASPHETKPGTTMPSLFDSWDENERAEAALALVSYLADDVRHHHSPADPRNAAKGGALFHTVGCVACHAPPEGTAPEATSVSLAGIEEKYNLDALAAFLKNPHDLRPSGRMPGLHLSPEESRQIAQYLLRKDIGNLPPNVHYKVYHGEWTSLPNFDELTPVAEGDCVGFDLGVAKRADKFGIRFEGYLPKLPSLTVEVGLGSDDGARLILDGITAIETNGVHPFQMHQKTVRMESVPVHHVRLDYFELAGEEELAATINTQGKPPGDLGMLLQLTPKEEKSPVAPPAVQAAAVRTFDASLVERGRELFATLGCANCHEFQEQGKPVESKLNSPKLVDLGFKAGCLADRTTGNVLRPVPQFDLSPGQRRDLRMFGALVEGNIDTSPQSRIERTMIAFNCYACHERQGQGGPEPGRMEFFDCSDHEMGDEGRLPPRLTGVGDKLQDQWLKRVLDQGARNRPYMFTRMPAFGGANVGHLAEYFIALDRRTESHPATLDEPLHRVKSTGRQLVGNGGLACIKCHNFGENKGTGIQAVSLTEMTGRIREDWFLRYLFDPARYRPGTRMPTGFPNGQAVIRDVYHGDPGKQLTAIWKYLEDGDRAGAPEGLVASMIELTPTTEPILYRNFMEDASPRSMAVGYPQKVNLIWDINELALRRIWHDRFIDASRHWTNRGAGQQGPLGDHIVNIETEVPFAQLSSLETPWPKQSPRGNSAFKFRGYRLNEKGEPAFRYDSPFGAVTDFPEPVAVNEHEGYLRRHLTVQVVPDMHDLYFRAASARKIDTLENGYRIDGNVELKFTGGGTAVIRKSADGQELLIPLVAGDDGTVRLIEEIRW